MTTTSALAPRSPTSILVVQNLLALVANGLPAYAVIYHGVDPFQVLMLYWMETAIVGFWMVLTLARLPTHLLGEVTINGRTQPATNANMVELFGLMILIFMAVHFVLLWLLFSGDWPHRVTGPVSFVREFVVASGAWLPLALMFLAGFVGFLQSPARPGFVDAVHARLYPGRSLRAPMPATPSDGVGPVVGGALGRIVMMQVAVIFGAMLVRSYGS